MQATVQDPSLPTQAPAAPSTPAAGGTNVIVRTDASPASVYTAFDQQGKVLREQLEGALDQRSEEIAKLANMSGNDFAEARAGVQTRIARLDKRISGLEEQIQQVDAQTAAAAGVPGAIVPPEPYRGGDEGEAFAGGMATATALIVVFLLLKRRFWRRKNKAQRMGANLQLPAEITTRMERLENIAESTALEVERIGEGQRFVTKLLSEQQKVGVPLK